MYVMKVASGGGGGGPKEDNPKRFTKYRRNPRKGIDYFFKFLT